MVAPCRRRSCRYARRLDRGADRVEVPEPRGLRRLRLQMVEVARLCEEVHDPRRVRGRSSRTWRIVIHDVERVGPGDFDGLLDEVPVPVDDLSAHARGPGPREIFDAERREELLDLLR